MNIKAVVFDCDDTLLDYTALKRQCIMASVEAMITNGLTLPKTKAFEKIYTLYCTSGFENQNIFDQFMMQELGKIDYKMLAASVIAYRHAKASIHAFPGISSVLIELLKRGIKLGVVSDAPKLQCYTRLTEAHLQDFFDIDKVVAFEDTGKRKPNPEPFKLILQRLGTNPSETLFIGDWASRDMLGAKAAGMQTGYVMYHPESNKTVEEDMWDLIDFELKTVPDILGAVDGKLQIRNQPKMEVVK